MRRNTKREKKLKKFLGSSWFLDFSAFWGLFIILLIFFLPLIVVSRIKHTVPNSYPSAHSKIVYSPTTNKSHVISLSSQDYFFENYKKVPAFVTRIIDGDTIVVDTGEHIRYLWVDTPEFHSKEDGTREPGAVESTLRNRELVANKEVVLYVPKDKNERIDSYGRTLAFVYVANGDYLECVNYILLKEKLAELYYTDKWAGTPVRIKK